MLQSKIPSFKSKAISIIAEETTDLGHHELSIVIRCLPTCQLRGLLVSIELKKLILNYYFMNFPWYLFKILNVE